MSGCVRWAGQQASFLLPWRGAWSVARDSSVSNTAALWHSTWFWNQGLDAQHPALTRKPWCSPMSAVTLQLCVLIRQLEQLFLLTSQRPDCRSPWFACLYVHSSVLHQNGSPLCFSLPGGMHGAESGCTLPGGLGKCPGVLTLLAGLRSG